MRSRSLVHVTMTLVLFASALLIGKLHAMMRGEYDLSRSSQMWWMLGFALVASLVGYAFGFPEGDSRVLPIGKAFLAAVTVPVAVALTQAVLGDFILPRFFLFLSIPVNAMIFVGFWAASRRLIRTQAMRERVVLFCSADEAEIVRLDVEMTVEQPFEIIRSFRPEEIQDVDAVLSGCGEFPPTVVVFSADVAQLPSVTEALFRLHAQGCRVRDLSGFYDVFIGKVPIREMESTAILFDVKEIHHRSYLRSSRFVDVVVGMVGCLILMLVTPFVFIGNLLGNRGSLFYSQDRVGKGMQLFKILKFRSMVPGGATTQWTAENDPRVTRFGRFLRLSHLDELPQVINILRGDLSLVGPRPEQPHYVQELLRVVPYYEARHWVRPGLTGWAQVNYPYGADQVDAFEKLQFDFWYLRHQSLVLDFRIMARTLRHVLGFRGR